MDEQYEAALRLLREQATRGVDQGEQTRRRVLATLRARRARRSVRVLALALAGCFALSSAFAYYVISDRDRARELPALRPRGAARAPVAAPSMAGTQAGAPAAGSSGSSQASSAVQIVPAASVQKQSAEVRQRRGGEAADPARAQRIETGRSVLVQRVATRRSTQDGARAAASGVERKPRAEASDPSAATRRAGSAAPSVRSESDLHALYLAAHQLHFRGAPSAALAAWDRYLAAQPQGPLAIEARYNRGVVLARLGRWQEAREALAPFARGDFGTFRKADAALVLSRMQAR